MASTDTMTLELCAPESVRVHLTVREVHVPGSAGYFTVLPGHTALLSTIIPGVLMGIDEAGNEHFFALNKGFVEVRNNQVTVLADSFEEGEEVDPKRAEAALERAKERLQHANEPDISVERAERSLSRSLARLSAKHRERHF